MSSIDSESFVEIFSVYEIRQAYYFSKSHTRAFISILQSAGSMCKMPSLASSILLRSGFFAGKCWHTIKVIEESRLVLRRTPIQYIFQFVQIRYF